MTPAAYLIGGIVLVAGVGIGIVSFLRGERGIKGFYEDGAGLNAMRSAEFTQRPLPGPVGLPVYDPLITGPSIDAGAAGQLISIAVGHEDRVVIAHVQQLIDSAAPTLRFRLRSSDPVWIDPSGDVVVEVRTWATTRSHPSVLMPNVVADADGPALRSPRAALPAAQEIDLAQRILASSSPVAAADGVFERMWADPSQLVPGPTALPAGAPLGYDPVLVAPSADSESTTSSATLGEQERGVVRLVQRLAAHTTPELQLRIADGRPVWVDGHGTVLIRIEDPATTASRLPDVTFPRAGAEDAAALRRLSQPTHVMRYDEQDLAAALRRATMGEEPSAG